MKSVLDKVLDFLRPHKKRVILLVVVFMAFLLVMDYNSRTTALYVVNRERERVQTHSGELKLTAQCLKTEIAYVTSDAGVAGWVRNTGHMILPGDVPVVPVPPDSKLPTPIPTPVPTPQPVANWQVWLALFFSN